MSWLNSSTLFGSWRTLQANPFRLFVQTMVENTPPLTLAIFVLQRAFLENLFPHTRHKEMASLRGEIALYLISQDVFYLRNHSRDIFGAKRLRRQGTSSTFAQQNITLTGHQMNYFRVRNLLSTIYVFLVPQLLHIFHTPHGQNSTPVQNGAFFLALTRQLGRIDATAHQQGKCLSPGISSLMKTLLLMQITILLQWRYPPTTISLHRLTQKNIEFFLNISHLLLP